MSEQQEKQLARLFTKVEDGDTEKAELQNMIELGKKYKYLILIDGEYVSNYCERYRTYEIIQGRQDAYDFIKTMLKAQDNGDCEYIIDVSTSHIIAEPPAEIIKNTPRITLSNMISIFSFMTAMRRNSLIVDDDDSFNIDNYFDGFIESMEDDEEE